MIVTGPQISVASTIMWISLKQAGVVELIPLENVEFIKESGYYSEVYTSEQSCLLHDKNLDKLHIGLHKFETKNPSKPNT